MTIHEYETFAQALSFFAALSCPVSPSPSLHRHRLRVTPVAPMPDRHVQRSGRPVRRLWSMLKNGMKKKKLDNDALCWGIPFQSLMSDAVL